MHKTKTRKRPCRICRRWFLPDVRQKQKQVTCARAACQKERHWRQCQNWNKKHAAYFKANYLAAKLERVKDPPVRPPPSSAVPTSRINLALPREVIIETIGGELLVIVEYVATQIARRSRGLAMRQPP